MPKSRKRPKKKAKPDQHAQFVEFARSIGADMDEETFKRAIGGIAKTNPEGRYGGMTVNERLFAAGIIEQFDSVARSRNRERMVTLLGTVELADQAAQITDSILANPTKYGY